MASIQENELWYDFFHAYKNLPELWKVNSEDYRDKKKKKRAMETLLEAYLAIDPNANIDSLKHKLLSIRACFRRELRKVEESERSGATDDELYVPNLWYYEPLLFLRDERAERYLQNKLQQQEREQEQDQLKIDDDLQYNEDTIDSFNEMVLEEKFVAFDTALKSPETSPPAPMRKRRRLSTATTEHFKSIDDESCERLLRRRHAKCNREHGICECRKHGSRVVGEREERDCDEPSGCERRDEAAVLAEGWAIFYRKLSGQQQLCAKKAIDDILFLGQLDKLTLQTVPFDKFL